MSTFVVDDVSAMRRRKTSSLVYFLYIALFPYTRFLCFFFYYHKFDCLRSFSLSHIFKKKLGFCWCKRENGRGKKHFRNVSKRYSIKFVLMYWIYADSGVKISRLNFWKLMNSNLKVRDFVWKPLIELYYDEWFSYAPFTLGMFKEDSCSGISKRMTEFDFFFFFGAFEENQKALFGIGRKGKKEGDRNRMFLGMR